MPRTARTVGIAIDEELQDALDEVVDHFAGGNRSEFIRAAVRDYQGRLRMERMNTLRARARDEADGRILSAEEIMTLIRETPAEMPGADPA